MKKLIFIFIINSVVFLNAEAQNEIKNLSNGALLIRLNTNENVISYHLRNDNIEKANAIREQQRNRNIEIIEKFKKEWSFSLVYFFYSQDSEKIKKSNFDNVFKDANESKLNKDEKINIKNNFIVGFFGRTKGSLKFDALILTDKKFETLKKPQPRMVRTYKGLWFLERKLSRIIQILEKKIQFYHLRIK